MSHLVINFEHKKHQSYDLARHPLDPGAIPDSKFELHDATVLHNGKDTIIYRGMLERNDGVRREAVAKIGWHDTEPHSEKSLIREFILYNGLLKPLQRKIVPVCHGLFKGNTQFGVVTCLLLSYIGTHENSNTPWRMLTPDIKLKLVSAIKRLHRAGVQHNDIDSENVILNNGRWWVIDFGEATPHQCKRTMRIKEGIICPEPVGFGCGELWGITMALGVWRTGVLRIFGEQMAERPIKKKDDILKAMRPFGFLATVPPARLNEAVDNIWTYLNAIMTSPTKTRPREYWDYHGEY